MRLETERLILREFTSEDFETFASLMADPEVMRFSVSGPMKDMSRVKEHFQKRILDHYTQYGHGFYVTFNKEDDCFVGGIGLMTQNIDGENKVELGYRLHPQYWGKGLATEACLAMCKYAFTQLGMEDLISIIDPKNTRSIAVAERIGMKYLKDTSFHDMPVQIYRILSTTA